MCIGLADEVTVATLVGCVVGSADAEAGEVMALTCLTLSTNEWMCSGVASSACDAMDSCCGECVSSIKDNITCETYYWAKNNS